MKVLYQFELIGAGLPDSNRCGAGYYSRRSFALQCFSRLVMSWSLR